jgi:hypothetical protein
MTLIDQENASIQPKKAVPVKDRDRRVVGQFGLYLLLIETVGGGTRSDLISTAASARWSSSTNDS